jgi:hypothetical protein
LWARELIRELDDESSPRRGSQQKRDEADSARHKRLVELGTRYQLLSSATSFVAVAERDPKDRTETQAELRRIPVALTHGWGSGPAQSPMVTIPRVGGGRVPSVPARMVLSVAPMAIAGELAHGISRNLATAHASTLNEIEVRVWRRRESSDRGSDQSDRLYDLLMTQRANGSFAESPALLALLGAERLARWTQARASADERIAITSLVVRLLEREHSAREAEWRPAVRKAKAWLAKQSTTFDPSIVID